MSSLTPRFGHFAPLNYSLWSVGKQCISITRLRDHYKVNLRVDQSKHNIKVNNQSIQIKKLIEDWKKCYKHIQGDCFYPTQRKNISAHSFWVSKAAVMILEQQL